MGSPLFYSLNTIHKRDEAKDILRCLFPLLDSESRTRFADLDWTPATEERLMLNIGVEGVCARGVAGLVLAKGEKDDFVDLGLAINLEPEFRKILGRKGWHEENGLTSVGGFWFSVQAGEKYVLLQLTASNSQLSRVLVESKVILPLWRDYAERSNAILAFLHQNDAEKKEHLLFPLNREADFPNEDSLWFPDGSGPSVDHFVNFVLSGLRERE